MPLYQDLICLASFGNAVQIFGPEHLKIWNPTSAGTLNFCRKKVWLCLVCTDMLLMQRLPWQYVFCSSFFHLNFQTIFVSGKPMVITLSWSTCISKFQQQLDLAFTLRCVGLDLNVFVCISNHEFNYKYSGEQKSWTTSFFAIVFAIIFDLPRVDLRNRRNRMEGKNLGMRKDIEIERKTFLKTKISDFCTPLYFKTILINNTSSGLSFSMHGRPY